MLNKNRIKCLLILAMLLSITTMNYAQCFVSKTDGVFVLRRLEVYDKNFNIGLDLQKLYIANSSTYSIFFVLSGPSEYVKYSDILQVTFENDEKMDIYLPFKSDPQFYKSNVILGSSGDFKEDDNILLRLKSNPIKKAILINSNNNFVKLKIDKNYFIDGLKCLENLQ